MLKLPDADCDDELACMFIEEQTKNIKLTLQSDTHQTPNSNVPTVSGTDLCSSY